MSARKPSKAKPPEIRPNEDVALDEMVAFGAYVHLEQMGETAWWMAVESGGQLVHVWFHARSKITATAEVQL